MMRARAAILCLALPAIAACSRHAGEVTVLFAFGEQRPASDAAVFISAWIESRDEIDSGARLASIDPTRFATDMTIDFGNLPNRHPMLMRAVLTDARFRNSRMLFHGGSEIFSIEPDVAKTISVLFEPGADKHVPVEIAPPAIDRIVYRRFPFGADETQGEERYVLAGAPGAVTANAGVIAFDRRDIAGATELGAAHADDTGSFTLTLDRSIARIESAIFVATIDGEQRASDASNEAEGLQASPVETIALTITAARDDAAPKIDRAALLEPALVQPSLERIREEELSSLRRRDGRALSVALDPIWLNADQATIARVGSSFSSMTYDSKRGVLVSFGGLEIDAHISAETWEWSDEVWRRPSPVEERPAPRQRPALAYDAARERTVLFGGIRTADDGDTWEWDGVQWRERRFEPDADVPSPRYSHAMTYDSDRSRVLLFGGHSTPNEIDLDDLWEWNGEKWERITVSGDRPSPRASLGLAYDRRNKRMVMFGGGETSPISNDTWLYDPASATWTQAAPMHRPELRHRHAMAYDPIRERVVLFGGDDNAQYFDDTWEWDGSDWMRFDAPGPSLRTAGALAYDAIAGGVVLYGGIHGAQVFAETWVWNGSSWNERSQPPSPGAPDARHAAAASADLSREVIVLVGGTGDTSGLGDLWEREHGRWTVRTPEPIEALPSARTDASWIYDPDRRVSVLFGGLYEGANRVQIYDPHTWTFDGAHWSELELPSPPERNGAASAWDDTHHRVLLFGGFGYSMLHDLWVYDGASWSQLAFDFGPQGRALAAMAYDSARARAVMFGGYVYTQPLLLSDQTWVWDDSWTLLETLPRPTPRFAHAMVYDPLRGNIVLFGGQDFDSSARHGRTRDDTWIWDGTRWMEVDVSLRPPPREGHHMVFDQGRGVVVMFGGYSLFGNVERDDTWEWNGESWSEVLPQDPRPRPREDAAMVYDAARDRTFVFAGLSPPAYVRDLWSFDGTRWSDRTPATIAPPPLRGHALAFHEPSRSTLLFGGVPESGEYSSAAWTWNGRTWSAVEGPLPAREAHAMARDPHLAVLLFGGYNESGLLGDTWSFDGTWREERPSNAPSPRQYHAMAEESIGGRTILYGGSDREGPRDDTWIWDGADWTPHTGSSPPARAEHAMAFDPLHERIVLFGGLSADALLKDTWQWTRDGWALLDPRGSLPEARRQHTLAFDPARKRVVLFGGTTNLVEDGAGLSDTWELLAPVDQRAGVLIEVSPAELGIARDRIRGLGAQAEGNASDVLAWDVRDGRWRSDFTRTSSSAIDRLLDREGSIHLLIRANEMEALALDYCEVTITYRGASSLR